MHTHCTLLQQRRYKVLVFSSGKYLLALIRLIQGFWIWMRCQHLRLCSETLRHVTSQMDALVFVFAGNSLSFSVVYKRPSDLYKYTLSTDCQYFFISLHCNVAIADLLCQLHTKEHPTAFCKELGRVFRRAFRKGKKERKKTPSVIAFCASWIVTNNSVPLLSERFLGIKRTVKLNGNKDKLKQHTVTWPLGRLWTQTNLRLSGTL